jgi:3-hydroxymyristoyl/3-hydroxydecanoyl-(acyl carrier protein) dehydratase
VPFLDIYLNSSPLLGNDAIKQLLPHRTPFLFIESLLSFKHRPNPSIIAKYPIQDCDTIYSDIIKKRLWPPFNIVEGLGQCCNLLIVLSTIEKRLKKAGYDTNNMDEILGGLREKRNDSLTKMITESLKDNFKGISSRIDLMGSIDIEVLGMVEKGQVIFYDVLQRQTFKILSHFTTCAYVNKKVVARGTLIGARKERL